MSLRHFAFVAASFALSCGRSSLATAPLDDTSSASASSGASSSSAASSTSGEIPCPEPDPGDIVTLASIRTGTLFGRALHVQGVIGGEDGYAIIDVTAAPARLLALRPDLLGGARWIHTTGPYHARLRGTQIDVLDASSAAEPVVVSSTELGSAPTGGFANTLSSDGQGLFLALWSEPEQGNFLHRLDLADPAHPGPPVRLEAFPFATVGNQAEARGSLWITWSAGDVALYDLTAQASIDSHGFVPDGVHHYGALTRLKTDGLAAATTMENEAYAFLYYANDPSFVVYSSFGGGEKTLLDVIDGTALLAVPRAGGGRAVVAFQVEPPPAREQKAASTGMDVLLLGSEGPMEGYRALASDAGHVIVADGERLFDVTLGSVGSVAALTVVRQGAPPCL